MSSSFSETNRISLIWRHPLYQKHCEKIQELEKDRIFCRHTPEHFLDVARLMYIYSLENKLNLSGKSFMPLLFFMTLAVRSNICRVFLMTLQELK